jgi:hypothetical protein
MVDGAPAIPDRAVFEGYKKSERAPYHLNFIGKSHFLLKGNEIPDMCPGLIANQTSRDSHPYTQLADYGSMPSYFTEYNLYHFTFYPKLNKSVKTVIKHSHEHLSQ